ncbi:hypothetical protein 83R [Ranavirus ambystoma1]|uniref:Uncharacterized protein n=1 Tax=Ranavirus ambystoma1 TaxID=265294 RepID=A0A0U2RT38_9VIRU|nr:hypothetical protein 83R [Ambystoma tigrinum virus]ALN37688.1 hypothetical protein 91R [Ambystoma tigrinum virus]
MQISKTVMCAVSWAVTGLVLNVAVRFALEPFKESMGQGWHIATRVAVKSAIVIALADSLSDSPVTMTLFVMALSASPE